MENFFALQLPVYGRIGERSVWDRSGNNPVVLKLNYEFDFMPESELFKTFPIFIASNRLAESFLQREFSGIDVAEMSIDVSETFLKLHPDAKRPSNYSWLKVHGRPQLDDFGVNAQSMLVVSNRVMEHLRGYQVRDFLQYSAEVPLKPNQVENDLFDAARKFVEESKKLRGES